MTSVLAGFTGAELDLAAPGALAALATRAGCPVVVARQVHGSDLIWVEGRPAQAVSDAGTGDGLATQRQGVALVVKTADCVPVLLAAPTAPLPVVAAVHAGWRGVLGRIVPQVVAQLRAKGVGAIEAAIGPAACGQCYEVSAELAGRFRAAGEIVSRTRQGTPSLELAAAVERQLRASGQISQIWRSGKCTICSAGYFSYRRQGTAAGRQCGFIAMWPSDNTPEKLPPKSALGALGWRWATSPP
ncbi:MAG: polyphenol oxidase family protein [Micrococcales bacterium]|nr:polyphenol oxidase family protein [Micrococcales bacterium]